jgi:hypothetical protein
MIPPPAGTKRRIKSKWRKRKRSYKTRAIGTIPQPPAAFPLVCEPRLFVLCRMEQMAAEFGNMLEETLQKMVHLPDLVI